MSTKSKSQWPSYPRDLDRDLVVFLESLKTVAVAADLPSFNITSPADKHAILYNATVSEWQNRLINFTDISGSIANAQVPESAVTQHQAALVIAESQITDGTILARVAADETISGSWTFSHATAPIKTDIIAERTVDSGVTVDGLLIKDSGIPEAAVTAHQAALSIAFTQLTGTIADAQVPQSAVTQHQAALSIAETQIPDGAIFARVAGNETITGSWVFSTPQQQFTGGSASTPAIHLGDSTTGLYRPSVNGLAWSINGTSIWVLDSAGTRIATALRIGSIGAPPPAQTDVYVSVLASYSSGLYYTMRLASQPTSTATLNTAWGLSEETYFVCTGAFTTAGGIKIQSGSTGSGQIGTFYSLLISPIYLGNSYVGTQYGMKIEDVNKGSTCYSIYTGAGAVRFGDTVIFESVAPVLKFRESDQTLPAGLWRIAVDGNAWRIDRNTAAAGDFSTYARVFKIATDDKIYIGDNDDTGIYRGAANTLATDDNLTVGGTVSVSLGLAVRGAAPTPAGPGLEIEYDTTLSLSDILSFNRTTTAYVPLRIRGSYIRFDIEGNERLKLGADGKLYLGGSDDTCLYRSSADVLVTDDIFVCPALQVKKNVETSIIQQHTGLANNPRWQLGRMSSGYFRFLYNDDVTSEYVVFQMTKLGALAILPGGLITDPSSIAFSASRAVVGYEASSTNAYLSSGSSIGLSLRTDSTERVKIAHTTGTMTVSGGNFVMDGGNIYYTATNFLVLANTADASDTKRIQLCGGGSNGASRGAYIGVMGNEYSTQEGDLALLAGNSGVSGHGKISFYTGNVVERANFDKDGTFNVLCPTVVTGTITTQGASAGLIFKDRGTAASWQWYATSSIARLYAPGGTDVLTCTLGGVVRFNNTYSFPATDGSSGQVLVTDGSGGLTWQNQGAGGHGNLTFNGDMLENTDLISYTGLAGGTTAGGLGANILLYGPSSGSPNLTVFRTGTTERLRITSSGHLLIGTTTDSAMLTVNGDAVVDCVIVTADYSGAATNAVAFTNVTTAVSTGTGTVKMGGITNRNSVGWLKFVRNSTVYQIPYWQTIS